MCIRDRLKTTQLWDFFAPHIYSADCVKNGKPDPDIYLYAADKLGTAPSDCLVIEDSTHGVQAGLSAGMTVWGFTGGGHCFAGHGERLSAAGAAWVAADFKGLSDRLAVMPAH